MPLECIGPPGWSGTAYRLLGVRVDDVTMEEAVAWVDSTIRIGTPSQIATVNVEFLVAAQRDEAFLESLNRADLCVPDSIGILWQARILGRRLRRRVPGVDLVRAVASLATKRGYRLFLLGAAPGVAELAARNLVSANPGLQIAGTFCGTPDPSQEERISEIVRDARPDILFVAYGAPKQELWIARNITNCETHVAMGVGGSLDFIAGVVRRAPKTWRSAGFEWLYRLLSQPWRWRRMLALPNGLALSIHARLIHGKAKVLETRRPVSLSN